MAFGLAIEVILRGYGGLHVSVFLLEGFVKYAVDMDTGCMFYLPIFVMID
jgi:hypothetical protein